MWTAGICGRRSGRSTPAAAYRRGDGPHRGGLRSGAGRRCGRFRAPSAQLAVGTLQAFLDALLQATARRWRWTTSTGMTWPGSWAASRATLSFLLPLMGKEQLFPHGDDGRRAAPQDLLHGRGAGQAVLSGSQEDPVKIQEQAPAEDQSGAGYFGPPVRRLPRAADGDAVRFPLRHSNGGGGLAPDFTLLADGFTVPARESPPWSSRRRKPFSPPSDGPCRP